MNALGIQISLFNTLAAFAIGLTIALPVHAQSDVDNSQREPDVIKSKPDSAPLDVNTGVIKGKIKFARATRLKRKELTNVIISLEDLTISDEQLEKARSERTKARDEASEDNRLRLIVDQKDLAFLPHTLPILIGETVEFRNNDPLYHNVYPGSGPGGFNLGMYPNTKPSQFKFDEAGIVELKCAVHSEMQAYILVMKNPYFVSVEKDGTFEIHHVPVGAHTITIWHPKIEPVEIEVTVDANKPVTIEREIDELKKK